MKKIIKTPNLPTKTMRCPHCGCEFTYTKADVDTYGEFLCPCCKNLIKAKGIIGQDQLFWIIFESLLGIIVFITLVYVLSLNQ